MMGLDLSDLSILGGGIVTSAGALWTLWRFIASRSGKAKVFAKISCKILDHADRSGSRIADIRLVVKNTGGERLNIKSIFISVRGIDKNAELTSDGPLGQANFPISIASKRRMFPDTWGYSYVDPDQTASYKHLAKIPRDIKAINIHGKIESLDPSIEFITVSDVVEV